MNDVKMMKFHEWINQTSEILMEKNARETVEMWYEDLIKEKAAHLVLQVCSISWKVIEYCRVWLNLGINERFIKFIGFFEGGFWRKLMVLKFLGIFKF